MALDPRLMMIDYSPIQQAAETFTTGMQNRRMKQVEGLAGQALMGDPSAMENLSQLDPMMAKKVQMQMEEQKYTQDQRDMQRKSALSKELREFYTQFGSIEDADEFIMKGSQALQSDVYPMMQDEMKRTGEFLDYSDYDTAKQFYEQSMRQAMLKRGDVDPSNVREWKYFNSLTPEQQKQYLAMKRSQQVVQLGGGGVGTLDVLGGGINEFLSSEEATGREAEKASQVAEKTKTGAERGENINKLEFLESNYPTMQKTVGILNELNDKATYTEGGLIADATFRQFGLEPPEGATAKAQATALVNATILPQLRPIFGSAFTEREGDKLVAVWGDPKASPTEKRAALNGMMMAIELEAETLRRRLGKPESKEIPTQQKPTTSKYKIEIVE